MFIIHNFFNPFYNLFLLICLKNFLTLKYEIYYQNNFIYFYYYYNTFFFIKKVITCCSIIYKSLFVFFTILFYQLKLYSFFNYIIKFYNCNLIV